MTRRTSSRTLRAALCAVVALGMLAAGLTAGATTAVAADPQLVNPVSGKCLDVTGARATSGTYVDLWDCNGGAHQGWVSTSAGELRTFGGSYCLDAQYGGTASGTRMQVWECTGGANQRFTRQSDGSIRGAESGRCLDVEGQSTAAGATVQLYTCNGGANQKWQSSAYGGSSGGTGTSTSCGYAPVDPRATTQARKLLCYLKGQYGNHVLSGQQESTWVDGPEYEMDYIRSNTGKYPAIRGMDYSDSRDFASRAASWWRAGGIPELSYHLGAPTKADSYDGSKMSVSINAVLTPGTAENASFNSRIDAVSGQLLSLQSQGVAVIWRPLHEAGGTWFWWSKEGGSQYQRVYRYMYNRMTATRGVHNVVWMLGFNGSPNAAFYPGKAYVDISGGDTYASNGNYAPQTAIYDATRRIVGTSMPVALHENGPIPDPAQLQSSGTRWIWFMTWHSSWLSATSVSQLRNVYSSPYVVTRDEVPDLG